MVLSINYSKQAINKSYLQWIATFGGFCLLMQVGILIGWASPNVAKLTGKNAEIPLTLSEASWVVASAPLGGFAGGFIAFICNERVGSRKTQLYSASLLVISWIFMIIANSFVWILTARFIGGVSQAMTFSSFSIFLGEVLKPMVRGSLIGTAVSGAYIGMFTATVAESYLSLKISSSIYLIQCVGMIMLFLWLMDSPYYLAKIGDFDKARESIAFYNINSDVDKEFGEIKSFVAVGGQPNIQDQLQHFKNPIIRKSLVIVSIIFSLPHVSGMASVSSYMETIATNGNFTVISPKEFVIYANIISIITAFLSLRLVDILGRRCLLIVSTFGTAASTTALGTYFYLIHSNFDAENLQWLAITAIISYLMTFMFGYASIPSVVLSEIFPNNFKSVAGFMAILSASVVEFAISKSFQSMTELLGESYVFWFYATLSIVFCLIALYLLPETKGKTFQEIQDLLSKK